MAMVLLILLAIAAVILIWFFLRRTVVESSEQVELERLCVLTYAEPIDCEYVEYVRYNPLDPDTPGRYITRTLMQQTQGLSTNLILAFKLEDDSIQTRPLGVLPILQRKLKIVDLPRKPETATVVPIVFNEDRSRNITCSFYKEIECRSSSNNGNLCDNIMTLGDIDAQVSATFNLAAYNQEYNPSGACPANPNADFNCDGNVDFFDIDSFLFALTEWTLCDAQDICNTFDCYDNFGNRLEGSQCEENCVP